MKKIHPLELMLEQAFHIGGNSLINKILLEANKLNEAIDHDLELRILNYLNGLPDKKEIMLNIARNTGVRNGKVLVNPMRQLNAKGFVNIVPNKATGSVVSITPSGEAYLTDESAQLSNKEIANTPGALFTNPKDISEYQSILNMLQDGKQMTQLEICIALGYETYNVRPTKVLNAMVKAGELAADRSARPMKLTLSNMGNKIAHHEIPDPLVAPIEQPIEQPVKQSVKQSVEQPAPKAQGSIKQVVQSLEEFNPGGNMVSDPAIKGKTVSVAFEGIGDWDSPEDDEMGDITWLDSSTYAKAFKKWASTQPWASSVKKIGAYGGANETCIFFVTLN